MPAMFECLHQGRDQLAAAVAPALPEQGLLTGRRSRWSRPRQRWRPRARSRDRGRGRASAPGPRIALPPRGERCVGGARPRHRATGAAAHGGRLPCGDCCLRSVHVDLEPALNPGVSARRLSANFLEGPRAWAPSRGIKEGFSCTHSGPGTSKASSRTVFLGRRSAGRRPFSADDGAGIGRRLYSASCMSTNERAGEGGHTGHQGAKNAPPVPSTPMESLLPPEHGLTVGRRSKPSDHRGDVAPPGSAGSGRERRPRPAQGSAASRLGGPMRQVAHRRGRRPTGPHPSLGSATYVLPRGRPEAARDPVRRQRRLCATAGTPPVTSQRGAGTNRTYLEQSRTEGSGHSNCRSAGCRCLVRDTLAWGEWFRREENPPPGSSGTGP